MKFIKLFTLLVLFSLQAGATGYSHNMFVAHKKLQAGKETKAVNELAALRKVSPAKIQEKAVSSTRHQKAESSFTRQVANKLSGMVTLNEKVIETESTSIFLEEDGEENDNSLVSKLVLSVKSILYAFIGSLSLGRS